MILLSRLRCLLVAMLGVTACSEPLLISPDAVLPDGSVYEGDFSDGKFNGTGKLLHPNGSSYEGQFVDGVFNGTGKFIDQDGNHFEGHFRNGIFHGEGTYTLADGTSYEGEFLDGRYHGIGKQVLVDGAVYQGEFANGLYHGQGTYKYEGMEYEGNFLDGVLAGNGSYVDYDQNRYEGEIIDWVANGDGTMTTKDGDVYIGYFESGYLAGEGRINYADGGSYQGNLSYGQPDGHGVKINSDNSTYTGEFTFGVYHGNGTLESFDNMTQESTIQKGVWDRGSMVLDESTGTVLHEQAEIALETHQTKLRASLDRLPSGHNNQVDWFFLAIAGDGSQSVFKREVDFAQQIFISRYGNADRTINLINHRATADQFPLATRRSIKQSLEAIAKKMDVEQDILFLYMTSHGSDDYEFRLHHNSIQLPPISAKELGQMLEASSIQYQVIVISACYSGGFIPELMSENALILTAADQSSQSFGCSDESEMTYFAKALLKETLAANSELTLVEAFHAAKSLVTQWEEDQELSPSNPQLFLGSQIASKLQSWRAGSTGN